MEGTILILGGGRISQSLIEKLRRTCKVEICRDPDLLKVENQNPDLIFIATSELPFVYIQKINRNRPDISFKERIKYTEARAKRIINSARMRKDKRWLT
jgi:hypothetical protein